MTNAYVYARISADMEGDSHGVNSQLRQCHDFATTRGWTVARDYVDNDISAYSGAHRPAFEELLADMTSGSVPVLIIWHLDRLCRRVADMSRVVEAAKTGGTQIYTVKAGDIDLSNASGELMAYLLGAIAQFEARHASERQVASQHDRALRGKWRGGKAPFGYRSLGAGRLEVNEEEAEWLRKWIQSTLSGESLLAIIRRTKEAVPDDHQLAKLSRYGLRTRMTNPAIAGLVKEHGEIAGKGEWEPIIDMDTFEAVVALLREPSRRTTQSVERRWQGSGVYRCGVCGSAVTTHKKANGGQGRTYTCKKYHVVIDQAKVDEVVDAVVVGYLSLPHHNVVSKGDDHGQELGRLSQDRAVLVERKDDLAVTFAEGLIDRTQLAAGTRALQERIQVIEKKIAELRKKSTVLDLVASAEDVAARWAELSPDRRSTVINDVVRVTILPAPKGARVPTQERLQFEGI